LYVDKHRVEQTFEVGHLVYLRLQPYKQSSLKSKGAEKLKLRFYGPYRVQRKVGPVAYELELPQGSKIHNLFHVSCLKRALGQHVVANDELPPIDEEGHLILILEEILEVRAKQLRNRGIKENLVKWKNLSIEYASWENEQMTQQAGSKLLVGKQFPVGETVMFPSPSQQQRWTK
jgi:hypothetical protein